MFLLKPAVNMSEFVALATAHDCETGSLRHFIEKGLYSSLYKVLKVAEEIVFTEILHNVFLL